MFEVTSAGQVEGEIAFTPRRQHAAGGDPAVGLHIYRADVGVCRVDGVGEMIVVRTVPGGAKRVASALDGESWPDVLGTVGGDDTILVVCRSSTARERLERRLRKLAEI